MRCLHAYLHALIRNFRSAFPRGRIVSDEPLGPDLPSKDDVLSFVLRTAQGALGPVIAAHAAGRALTRQEAANVVVTSVLSCFTPSIRLHVLRTLQVWGAALRWALLP